MKSKRSRPANSRRRVWPSGNPQLHFLLRRRGRASLRLSENVAVSWRSLSLAIASFLFACQLMKFR
jgi:hypothetical protein